MWSASIDVVVAFAPDAALSWCFVPAIQGVVGVLVISSVPANRIGMPGARVMLQTGGVGAPGRSDAHTVWRHVSPALTGTGLVGLVLFSSTSGEVS